MKRKFLTVLLVILSVFTLSFCLIGCVDHSDEDGVEHECIYDKQVTTSNLLASQPTCTAKAKYYYSCTCGKKGDQTFEFGVALGHLFENYVYDNNAVEGNSGTKTATCARENCSVTHTVAIDNGIVFKNFIVNGLNVNGGKVSNGITSFDFKTEIEKIGNSDFVVALDEFGVNISLTKIVPLEIGDNTFYVFEKVDGKIQKTYVVSIRRRPMHNVSFNTNGGTAVESQTVEEDSLAVEPQATVKFGYTFIGWDYDFSLPITQNLTINANIKVRPELAVFNYNLTTTTCEITGLKDKTVTEVIVPDFVTSIGDGAFYYCDSLTSVVIPNSVTSIGCYAFYSCYSLTIYCEAESNSNSWDSDWNSSNCPVVWNCLNNEVADDGYIYTIIDGIRYSLKDGKARVAMQPSNIVTASIPTNVTYKGNNYNVTSIDYKAFENCYSLTSVVFEESSQLTSIGEYAFYNCDSLESVVIPNSVTSIGSSAFSNCHSLISIEVAENNPNYKDIDGNLYSKDGTKLIQYAIGKKATTFTIPNGVTSIGERAFEYCYSLTSIVLPDSVTSIGNNAFEYCRSLISVVFEENSQLTSIGDRAFHDCYLLTSIVIPDSVTSIGDRAFRYCDSLESVVIPNIVTSIGSSAFEYCYSLIIYCEAESNSNSWDSDWNSSNRPVVWDCDNNEVADDGYIYTVINGLRYGIKDGVATVIRQSRNITTSNIPSSITYKGTNYSVTSIGSSAFSNCDSLESVIIPNSVTSIGSSAFSNCDSLISIEVAENNPNYKDIDGNLYSKDGTELIQYAIGKTATTFTIPNGVKSIGERAFSNCDSLESVVIPNSVTSIGDYAFTGCRSLTSIVIPDSVTSIGYYAFTGCESLTSIIIPNSVSSIGSSAFPNCFSLTIYCEAQSQPSGWHYFWNSERPVVWNCLNNEVADDGYIYTVIEGIRYGIKDGVATVVRQPSNLTTANIPSSITYKGTNYSVTSIGEYAFSFCDSLTSIIIPNSVTSIGSSAFSYCYSLTSIIIPNSVTSIGGWAFDDCDLLIIYCEAELEPSGWDSFWNSSNCPVYWYRETDPTISGNYWHYVNGVVTKW